VRFAHSAPAKLAARKRWTALSESLREAACCRSHAASAAAGSRGPQRPENDPVDHFQRGRAGRPRSGLPSLVGFGAKPQRNFSPSNFCLCMLSIRVQYDVTGNKAASTASGQAGEVGHAARKRAAKTGGRPEKMRKLIFPACRRLSYARKLSLRLLFTGADCLPLLSGRFARRDSKGAWILQRLPLPIT